MDPRVLTAALACALILPLSGSYASAQEPDPGFESQPGGQEPQQPLPPAAGLPPASDSTPDSEPPRLELGGRRGQRLDRVLEAFAMCSERCEFEASARVDGVPGLKYLRVVTPAKAGEGGTRMRFELRVSRRAHKLINGSLRAGRRVRVEVDVVAYDLAENSTQRTRWIRVRPPAPPQPPVKRS